MPTTTPLDTPVATLRATGTARLPFQHDILLRSFLLERPAGNVLVYNSPGLTDDAAAIADLGGATRLLVNHWHEAMYGDPALDVAVGVHERDRAETARSMRVHDTFDRRHLVDDDLEVIPTPGHTAGATCFLWDSGVHRFLFTGDSIVLQHGEWRTVALDESLREDYRASLAVIGDLDFDVLVPWGATDDGPCFAMTDRDDTRRRVDAMSRRLA